jgi:hypothetical protein
VSNQKLIECPFSTIRLAPKSKKKRDIVERAFQKVEELAEKVKLYLTQRIDLQNPLSLIYLNFRYHLQRKAVFIYSKLKTPNPRILWDDTL